MVSLTMEIPQLLLDEVVDVLLGRWCEFHRCRRGEDSCAPTIAPHELRWGIFQGSVHRYTAGAPCPQGHGPHHWVHSRDASSTEIRH